MQDIYDILKQDHRNVEAMLEQLSAVPSSDVRLRKQLFDAVREELIRHAEAEEHVFYTVLKQHEGTREIAMEGAQEHHQVRTLLREMEQAADFGSEVWTAKLKVLCENLEHHIREEEDEMFPKALRILSGKRAEAVAVEFREEKAHIEV